MPKVPAHKLNQYLSRAKTLARDNTIDMLVMGNEAADLDSMAAAVSLAYTLGSRSRAPSVLPLIPILREDFRLRTEAVFVFNRAGIDPGTLFFLNDIGDTKPDDLKFKAFMDRVKTLGLVDHNRLSDRFDPYANMISLIMDHHRDEGLYPSAKRTIEPAGSCATLAAEILIRDHPGLLDDHLATLLWGTILLDTVNLAPESGRVTIKDKAVARHLETICPFDRHPFYDSIRTAKFSTKGLSTRDLLRKDYKQFTFGRTRCGIASVLLSLDQWTTQDPKLAKAIETRAAEKELDILITMNAWTAPDFSRDLAVFCRDAVTHEHLISMLQSSALNLTAALPGKRFCINRGTLEFYHQGNPSISRKKLIPLLDTHFSL